MKTIYPEHLNNKAIFSNSNRALPGTRMKYKFLIPKQKEKEDKGQKNGVFARKISQFCAISIFKF